MSYDILFRRLAIGDRPCLNYGARHLHKVASTDMMGSSLNQHVAFKAPFTHPNKASSSGLLVRLDAPVYMHVTHVGTADNNFPEIGFPFTPKTRSFIMETGLDDIRGVEEVAEGRRSLSHPGTAHYYPSWHASL